MRRQITQREQEILELLAKGLTNKQIAKHLCISPFTVRDHVSSLFAKKGVFNRVQLLVHTTRPHFSDRSTANATVLSLQMTPYTSRDTEATHSLTITDAESIQSLRRG